MPRTPRHPVFAISVTKRCPWRHPILRRSRFTTAILFVLGVFLTLSAGAQQAPIALPNTVSTVGGGAASALTVGATCSTGNSQTATDTLGDGCPATSAYFGTTSSGDLRGGV